MGSSGEAAVTVQTDGADGTGSCCCCNSSDSSNEDHDGSSDDDRDLDDYDSTDEDRPRSRLTRCWLFVTKYYQNSFQRRIKALVEHKYFQQALLGAILINTLSMGIEYHNQVWAIQRSAK